MKLKNLSRLQLIGLGLVALAIVFEFCLACCNAWQDYVSETWWGIGFFDGIVEYIISFLSEMPVFFFRSLIYAAIGVNLFLFFDKSKPALMHAIICAVLATIALFSFGDGLFSTIRWFFRALFDFNFRGIFASSLSFSENWLLPLVAVVAYAFTAVDGFLKIKMPKFALIALGANAAACAIIRLLRTLFNFIYDIKYLFDSFRSFVSVIVGICEPLIVLVIGVATAAAIAAFIYSRNEELFKKENKAEEKAEQAEETPAEA